MRRSHRVSRHISVRRRFRLQAFSFYWLLCIVFWCLMLHTTCAGLVACANRPELKGVSGNLCVNELVGPLIGRAWGRNLSLLHNARRRGRVSAWKLPDRFRAGGMTSTWGNGGRIEEVRCRGAFRRKAGGEEGRRKGTLKIGDSDGGDGSVDGQRLVVWFLPPSP